MKKKLLLSNLGWLTLTLVVLMHSCNQSTAPEKIDNGISQQTAKCVEDEVSFMDAGFFLDGLARYKKYQWDASNNKLKTEKNLGNDFQDARSCWYSLDRLKNMICLTEKNAAKKGLTGELGIRFYYATYPDSIKQTVLVSVGNTPGKLNTLSTKADVGYHHTLFMVPTHYNEELHLDEDIFLLPTRRFDNNSENVATKEVNLRLITHPDWEMLQKHTGDAQFKIMVLGQAVPAATPSSKNQGMLCPPTCPGKPTATDAAVDARIIP